MFDVENTLSGERAPFFVGCHSEAIIGYSIYVYRVDPKVDRPKQEKSSEQRQDETTDDSVAAIWRDKE